MLAVGCQNLLWPFLVCPAVVADLLVKRHYMPALVALAVDLFVLVAPGQRGDRPQDRQEEADREPQPERAALPTADEGRGQSAEEADDDEAHAGHRDSLEHAERPDNGNDREYGHDDCCQSGHDPDHDLEQDPGGNDEDEDGQHPPAEVSCCCAHLLRVREGYKTKGGLVGTYRSRPSSGTEHMIQLGQKTLKPRTRSRCSRCHEVVLA